MYMFYILKKSSPGGKTCSPSSDDSYLEAANLHLRRVYYARTPCDAHASATWLLTIYGARCTTAHRCKIKEKKTRVLFIHHPSIHFLDR